MTQGWKTEWQYKFLKAGTEYDFGDLSAMINVVSELLKEQRLAVLEEVEREVEKKTKRIPKFDSETSRADVYASALSDISTIINQLKVK